MSPRYIHKSGVWNTRDIVACRDANNHGNAPIFCVKSRWIMDFLTNNSFLMMEKAMGYLWTKQAAILDNIANAETPNYKPKVVTFEERLRDRLDKARASATPRTSVREVLEESEFAVTEQLDTTRMDDNGVNVTEQSIEMIRNAYQLQYVMNAINTDLSTLRTAVRGQ